MRMTATGAKLTGEHEPLAERREDAEQLPADVGVQASV
jgi:hypothetical protein